MNRRPGIGVLTTDVELTVRSCTGWLARLTGVTPAAACGRLLTDVAPALARHEARGALAAALRHGTTSTLALAWPLTAPAHADNGDGHAAPLHARVGPLRSEGQITGVILTVSAGDDEAAGIRPLDGFRGAHWLARRDAVHGLGAARDAALVTEVLGLLREEHRDLDVAASAVTLLEATDVDVVDPLVDLLSEADADLRVQAVLLLGHRRDARAVRALLAVLDDADANVRFQAIESLGRLEAPEAVERLTAIAEAGDFFLAFPALSALARIGDRRVTPRLVPLLAEPMLSEAAAEALGELASPEAIAPLLALLDAPGAPVGAVVSAIDRLAARHGAGPDSHVARAVRAAVTPTRAQKLVEAVHHVGVPPRPLARVLGWLDGPAVTRALTRMLAREEARADAVAALVAAGPGVVDMLVDQLEAEDLETRCAAVVALGKIGDARAVPGLVQALDDAELVSRAVPALGAIGDARAFAPLARLLVHEAAGVRQAVLAALAKLDHADAQQRVLDWIDDADPRRREAAVKLVPRLAHRVAVEALRRGCVDAVETVRRAAVSALATIDDPRALPLVLDASSDGAPDVRAAALRALGDMDSAAVAITVTLLNGLADSDAWVRYFAARALGLRRTHDAVPALARVTREDPAPHVRIAAAEALAAIGGDEARAALTPLAESSNADLARVARDATGSPADGGAPPLETC